MKKYRAGKIKREHTVIEQLWSVLEAMAECEAIASIIPGPINRLATSGFEITFQRFTETGLRLLAKNGVALQELYLVSPDKEAALAWLVQRSLIKDRPETTPAAVANDSPVAPQSHKTVHLPADTACQVCGRLLLAGSRTVRLGERKYTYAHVRCVK